MPSVRVPKPPLSRPRLPPLYFGHPSGCGFCYASTMAPENGHEAVIAPVRLAVFLCLRSPPGAWIIQDPLGGNTPAVFVRFSGTRRPSCATTTTLTTPVSSRTSYSACSASLSYRRNWQTRRGWKAVCSEDQNETCPHSLAKLSWPRGRNPGRFRARGAWPDLGPPARGRLCRTKPGGGALATSAHDPRHPGCRLGASPISRRAPSSPGSHSTPSAGSGTASSSPPCSERT